MLDRKKFYCCIIIQLKLLSNNYDIGELLPYFQITVQNSYSVKSCSIAHNYIIIVISVMIGISSKITSQHYIESLTQNHKISINKIFDRPKS